MVEKIHSEILKRREEAARRIREQFEDQKDRRDMSKAIQIARRRKGLAALKAGEPIAREDIGKMGKVSEEEVWNTFLEVRGRRLKQGQRLTKKGVIIEEERKAEITGLPAATRLRSTREAKWADITDAEFRELKRIHLERSEGTVWGDTWGTDAIKATNNARELADLVGREGFGMDLARLRGEEWYIGYLEGKVK